MRNIVIDFKSKGIFFEKEKKGWKRNTIREVEMEDFRFDFLMEMCRNGPLKNSYIQITCVENPKIKFRRKISDVSFWKGFFIISW